MSSNNNAGPGNFSHEDLADEVLNNELTQEEKDAFQNALATIRRVHNMALPPRYSPEVCIQVAVKCQSLYGTINGILYANTQAYWRAAEHLYLTDLQDLLDYVRIHIN
ncbi:unnamed protein product [Caenorhabditis nigoni]